VSSIHNFAIVVGAVAGPPLPAVEEPVPLGVLLGALVVLDAAVRVDVVGRVEDDVVVVDDDVEDGDVVTVTSLLDVVCDDWVVVTVTLASSAPSALQADTPTARTGTAIHEMMLRRMPTPLCRDPLPRPVSSTPDPQDRRKRCSPASSDRHLRGHHPMTTCERSRFRQHGRELGATVET
jgi:hypothetical protein